MTGTVMARSCRACWRNGKPWKGGPPERPSATKRSAPSGTSGDGCGSVGAAIAGEGLAETAMSRLKRLGERLDAHGPPRQVAKVQIRCAVLNTFNAFGMPDTVAEAWSNRQRPKHVLSLIAATAPSPAISGVGKGCKVGRCPVHSCGSTRMGEAAIG